MAPVLIENQINTVLPIFSHVVVIGDKKKYLTALLFMRLKDPLNLDPEITDYLRQRGSEVTTIDQAMKCDKLKAIIADGIEKANDKAISRAQRIIKFKVMPVELSVDSNTLTPTLKLKRKIINQIFQAEIESLYIDPKL